MHRTYAVGCNHVELKKIFIFNRLWLPLTLTSCLGGTWDQHVPLSTPPGPLRVSAAPRAPRALRSPCFNVELETN
ncbi:unnamed protein product [Boreogadus saida]